MTKAEREQLKSFLERAFWIVGAFCFLWETLVMATLYRVTPEVELPLMGKCSHGEAINLTLTFFWPVLLALHWLVHMYQSLTKGARKSARFPGLLRDLPIPNKFASFRILLFVVLLVWPTVAHEIVTERSFAHMSIVYDYGGEAYLVPNDCRKASEKQAERCVLRYHGTAQLSWLCVPTDENGKVRGEWRWLHFRDEDKHFVYCEADENKPAGWALKPEHWPTAYPFFQPWGFVVVAIGFAASTTWMIVRVVLKM